MTWWPRRRCKNVAVPQAWTPAPLPPVQTQRRYLEDTEYPLPKDEGEKSWLDFQHHALHLTLGNHYLAPLPPQMQTILDVGAGTGIWACDMARTFPQAIVLGLDIDTALFALVRPFNCLLRRGDVLKGLPLPDAMFEFTHQRFMVLAIPDDQWSKVVRELVRVTRPNGWIELVESDGKMHDAGPATTQMLGWIDLVREARGIMGASVAHLGDMLSQEGVTEVEVQSIPVKVGAWGGRAGHMMQQDLMAAVQGLKEQCCAQGVDPQEYDRCAQAMDREWQHTRASVTIQVAYGRR